MRRFNFYLPEELFERIKLLAKFYNVPITKIMAKLLEIGYIETLDTRKTNKIFYKIEGLGDDHENFKNNGGI